MWILYVYSKFSKLEIIEKKIENFKFCDIFFRMTAIYKLLNFFCTNLALCVAFLIDNKIKLDSSFGVIHIFTYLIILIAIKNPSRHKVQRVVVSLAGVIKYIWLNNFFSKKWVSALDLHHCTFRDIHAHLF